MIRKLGLICTAIFLAGCAATAEEPPDPNWYGEGTVVHKLAYEDCYYLKIYDNTNVEHESCVSEHVWNDAMLGHKINITKEYH